MHCTAVEEVSFFWIKFLQGHFRLSPGDFGSTFFFLTLQMSVDSCNAAVKLVINDGLFGGNLDLVLISVS